MKSILIVGASGGIGNKTSELLLSEGYRVIGTYFQHPERAKNLGGNAQFSIQSLDIRKPESVIALQKQLKGQELFAVINCSGIVRHETNNLTDDLRIWTDTIDTNLTGNYLLAKVFANTLAENGRFIMMSSTDAFFGGTITVSYAASKSGVNSLTKSLSLLFKDRKIRVNSLAPGWVRTPMIADNGEEFLNKVASINPLGRNADPIDVAKVVSFLLSDAADYINGQVIPLEGGYTNQDPTLLLEQEVQENK